MAALLERSSWIETQERALSLQDLGVHSLWIEDDRDPLILFGALSRHVDTLRFGIFLDPLKSRRPALVAKALATLHVATSSRIDIAYSDAAFYGSVVEASLAMKPSLAGLKAWSLSGQAAPEDCAEIIEAAKAPTNESVGLAINRGYLRT